MTNQQKAQLLMGQLNEKNLALVIQYMADLLFEEQNDNNSTMKKTEARKKELLEEFKKLLEKSRHYPAIDIDSARRDAMCEKYGEFMQP